VQYVLSLVEGHVVENRAEGLIVES